MREGGCFGDWVHIPPPVRLINTLVCQASALVGPLDAPDQSMPACDVVAQWEAAVQHATAHAGHARGTSYKGGVVVVAHTVCHTDCIATA